MQTTTLTVLEKMHWKEGAVLRRKMTGFLNRWKESHKKKCLLINGAR